MRRLPLLLLPLVLLMSACGSDDDDDAGGTAVPPSSSTGRPLTTVPGAITPGSGAPSTSPGSTPQSGTDAEQAIADLAARQDVEPSEITTVSVDEVTWRSGAIGCPQPDMNYTQSLVPGIRVVLELDGVQYEYHAGGGRSIFLCEDPESPVDG